MLEWSEIAGTAVSGDAQLESAAGLAFFARFFRLMMDAGEYRRLREHLREKNAHPDILVEIMQGVNELVEAKVEASAGRPTRQPSRSSAGRGATAERTLQIISLPDGEVEWADAPPESRQQRRAQQRRGNRRRAG